MTTTEIKYQMMHPRKERLIGSLYYDTVEDAIEETKRITRQAKENGHPLSVKWQIVQVTTATIRDDKDYFVSRTIDAKAIGIYDNGNVTMY